MKPMKLFKGPPSLMYFYEEVNRVVTHCGDRSVRSESLSTRKWLYPTFRYWLFGIASQKASGSPLSFSHCILGKASGD